MKKIKLLAVLLAMIFVISGCGAKIDESLDLSAAVSGMKNDISAAEYMLIAQNENIEFWFNKDTTAFKVVDKTDGYEWYSTGSVSQSENESSAPFTLSFVNETGLIEKMNAMTDSIAQGQYSYERIDNGLKVTYSLGEYESALNVPLAITKERLDFIADKIEDDFVKSQFQNMYQLTDFENLNEENQKIFSAQYPTLHKEKLYILREPIKQSAEKMKELGVLLQSNGYTDEMYQEDKKYFVTDDTEEDKENPQFRVQLVYTVDKDGLVVTVPDEEMQMSASFPVVEIELLKYFGAPSISDSGYFLLPDGSGSLMNFYNGKSELQDYSVNIYGLDYALAETENIYNFEQAYLPIFAIKNGTHGMFSVIEKGDAIATVNAYTGSEQLRAYVSPTFKLRAHYKSYVSGSNTTSNYFVSIENKRYDDDIKLRYVFSNGDNASYSGMAKWYREYLLGDKKDITDNSANVIVECVGQIDKTVKAFGFKQNKNIPLTTFSQVKEIAKQLKENGLEDISVKMSGWSNGAYRNRYAKKPDVNSKLGGEKEFKALAEYLNQNGIDFYPDVDFQYTYNTGLFDGFSTNSDVATLVSKSKGYRIEFNPATFYRDSKYSAPAFINSPSAIKNAFASFFNEYKNFNIKSVSLRNIGKNLDGDYDDKNGTNRQKVADLLRESVKNVSKDYEVMTNGANAYLLNEIDYCCLVPLESNKLDITDESVPFLQMVLSGKVGYSGPVINLSGSPENVILDMAAVAADAYYTVSYQNSQEVRNSEYSYLYSSNFQYIKDSMLKLLKQYSKDMEGISGKQITDYVKLGDNLYRTVFADGSTVTVNYDINDITVEDVTYKAKSYVVDKKGEG